VADTIEVREGWNLIGTISRAVAAELIVTQPPGIVASEYYTLSASGSYQQSEMLEPGRGYWVKVSQAGIMIRSHQQ
jgi:hypothetical protein